MRKSFLWIATALCGVVYAGAVRADTNQNNHEHAAATTTQATATNNGTRSDPCPPRRVLTPEQRRIRAEAARRARDQRAAEEEARRAELDRARAAEMQAQNAATQAQNELAQARDAAARAEGDANQLRNRQSETERALQAERMRRLQLAGVLADRERADALRARHRRIVARGGGPLHYRPMFTFGFDGGIAGFANPDTWNTAYTGGTWGARIGVDFANWFGIEGRYFGMANQLNPDAVGGNAYLMTNGGTGVMRFTIPTPYVQPYGLAGVGAYHTREYRPSGGGNTVITPNTNLAVPLGIGLNVPIGRVVSVAAEGMYHALWDTTFNESGGEQRRPWEGNGIWNGVAVLRFRL